MELEDTSDLHCVSASDSASHSVALASSESPKAKYEPIGLADLDPYTRAATYALNQRDRKRKRTRCRRGQLPVLGQLRLRALPKL